MYQREEGDRIKRAPIIPIKWVNEQHDTDQDGVPNYRDCDILNPHEHELSLFPKFRDPHTKGLTKTKEYIVMWGKAFDIYEGVGALHSAILDTAPETKHPDIFNFINLKLNKKGDITFISILNKFRGEKRFVERVFETIKWMHSHGHIKVITDGYNIISLVKKKR